MSTHEKLFDNGYAHSERMKKIIAKEIQPNQEDIKELWKVYKDSESWVGAGTANLIDFGMWLCGDPRMLSAADPDGTKLNPCEVTW